MIATIRRHVTFIAFVLGFVLAWPALIQVVDAQGPACLKRYWTDLLHMEPFERRRIVGAVGSYDRLAQQGVETFIDLREFTDPDGVERLYQALVNFRYNKSVPNPFPNDRALMASIHAVDRSQPGVINLHRVTNDLGQEFATGLSQAAAMDLYVASSIPSGGISGFRVRVPFPGGDVEFDIVGSAGRWEIKSLVEPYNADAFSSVTVGPAGRLFYSDPRLTQLAQEFERHILVYRATPFGDWNLVFRQALAPQRTAIEGVLLDQFRSGPVVDQIRDAKELKDLKDAFIRRLPEGLKFTSR